LFAALTDKYRRGMFALQRRRQNGMKLPKQKVADRM
jgi:hypothetical protein